MTEPTMQREDGGPDEYECGDCGSVWTFSQLQPIDSYFERVSPGDVVPAGECPDVNCGALCSPVPVAAPAPAAARTTADETLDLLYKVAEDVSHLITCNCSHDLSEAEPWTCHGTCTHGMAVRALAAQLSAGAAKATRWYLVTGRVSGEAEDSLFVVRAKDEADAKRQAFAWLRDDDDGEDEDGDVSTDGPYLEDEDDCYLNFVIDCGAVEPTVEQGFPVRLPLQAKAVR